MTKAETINLLSLALLTNRMLEALLEHTKTCVVTGAEYDRGQIARTMAAATINSAAVLRALEGPNAEPQPPTPVPSDLN